MSFTGKVVLVTGAASGIGAATAELFAKEGALVAIVDIDGTKLQQVADRNTSNGRTMYAIPANVAKDEDAKKIVKETIKKFGKLDILVNCAGIMKLGTILDGKLMETYDTVMDVNLRAVMQITCQATPHLLKTKGNVVNITSTGAARTRPEHNAYCVSKIGVQHFTRSAALELAPHGVRVNAVSPGPTKTNLMVNTGDGISWSDWANVTALQRFSEPEEVGDLVMYLASDKAKGITGAEYLIDNGYLLKY